LFVNTILVNNDFHKTHEIFEIFKGLSVKNIDAGVAPSDGIPTDTQAAATSTEEPKASNN
jgi:hypothetical protein